jgi:hypothetical protein
MLHGQASSSTCRRRRGLCSCQGLCLNMSLREVTWCCVLTTGGSSRCPPATTHTGAFYSMLVPQERRPASQMRPRSGPPGALPPLQLTGGRHQRALSHYSQAQCLPVFGRSRSVISCPHCGSSPLWFKTHRDFLPLPEMTTARDHWRPLGSVAKENSRLLTSQPSPSQRLQLHTHTHTPLPSSPSFPRHQLGYHTHPKRSTL